MVLDDEDMVWGPITDPTKRNAEMERSIRESGGDPTMWLIYADWLQEHDNPRGEAVCRYNAKYKGDLLSI